MSDPDFTRSCYATDADLYKAKAEYYEAKVKELEYKLKEAIAIAEREVILRKERQTRVEGLKEKEYWANEFRNELKAKVDELTNLNNLLLNEHFLGGKISRHTSNDTWKNWVDACREVEAVLNQEEGIA